MLLPFSIRVAEWPPVWQRAVHSVYSTCLSWAMVKYYVCPFFPFGIGGGMWDVIVLIPEHCLSVYFLLIVLLLYALNHSSGSICYCFYSHLCFQTIA